jgi:CheY-like chemotaxis protein
MDRKLTTILIADDDQDDRMFLEQAMRKCGYTQAIRFVDDGEELMNYLQRRNNYTVDNAPWPNLLILDLNMPRKNGFQALKEIKEDNAMRRLPVIVMTTSTADEDVARSYNLGVNSFVTKPFHFSKLVEMISALKVYWLDIVRLP